MARKSVGSSLGLPPRHERMARVAAVVLASASVACASRAPIPPPAAPLSSPSDLCTEAAESGCLSPDHVENWLRSASLSILGAGETPGSSGAKILTLHVTPQEHATVTLRAKWREHNGSLFNDARKEIAAYATQKLLFEPHEYIVPPTVGRCFPIDPNPNPALGADAKPNLENTQCVFGSLSYWLEHVTPSKPYSEQRFWEDSRYRGAIADVNVFTYLIQHGDTHGGNFLVLEKNSRASGRIYSADNAIAFSSVFRNPLDLLGSNWYEIRVPALRRKVIRRLAELTRADLEDLSVIEQYRVDNGQVLPTAITASPPSDSAIRREGHTLQLGLTKGEIDQLENRLAILLERVESGDLVLF